MCKDPLIALELHDATLWEPTRVFPIVEAMETWGYNALVLHQNDLLDECTQLALTANYGVSDLRLKKVRNRAAWLNRLVARLAQFDAALFLEVKEPSFHDYALELFPDLLGAGGQPDPAAPAWAGFCRAKVEDVLARVPGLGGMIVNLSSPESRVSMPDHVATSGALVEKSIWFDRMIAAFSAPLAAQGKALYVRDFSYTEDMQSDVMDAVNRCDGAVQASVKVTAHDYFPRSPANPALGRVGAGSIVEFDAFGEHTGWGVIPNCRVAEFARRVAGLDGFGILVRTSWEAITGANALDSLSAVNVFALPRLVQADEDAGTIILAWLEDRFGLTGAVASEVCDLLLQSWNIPAAAYWGEEVFPRHSCLPSTWQEGWVSMETTGMGRRDLDVVAGPAHPLLSEAAREDLFEDKAAAVTLAGVLAEKAQNLAADVPPELAQLLKAFDWVTPFARQFELATQATFYAAKGSHAQLPRLKDALLALADEIEAQLSDAGDLPQHHHVLFDPAQIRVFTLSLPS